MILSILYFFGSYIIIPYLCIPIWNNNLNMYSIDIKPYLTGVIDNLINKSHKVGRLYCISRPSTNKLVMYDKISLKQSKLLKHNINANTNPMRSRPILHNYVKSKLLTQELSE